MVKGLGVEKAAVVGHDIGLMVAYAYAAQFPAETEKLVLMDAFLPGVEGWEAIYNDPAIWHFRFNGPTPGSAGRGTRAHLLRAFLERFRRRQDAIDSGSRSASLHIARMRGRDACVPDGRISCRFSRPRPTSRGSRRRS